MPPTDWSQAAQTLGSRARAAARQLAVTGTAAKNAALRAMAAGLRTRSETIRKANAADLAAAEQAGLTSAMIDRLTLTAERIEKMARSVEEIADLRDPVGETLEGYVRPNGLRIERVRVPLGVVLAIYESRPNVTSDVAALCLKSGNAAILRGGKEALRSNLPTPRARAGAAARLGLPADASLMV